MSIAPARPASTVVLLRSSASRFDVFLVRRHDKVAFMGGAHVFPGGRVDSGDRIEEPERICDGVAAAAARMPELDEPDAVAHYIAAIRELFEEAGVLLARPIVPRVLERRGDVAAGRLGMEALALGERIKFALDDLAHFAHWVTPEIEIKRFDTRFFVARVPDGQSAAHDAQETTHGEWIDPLVAIERARRDEIALPPPTWTTLQALAEFSTVEEVLEWARQRRIVRVQPQFVQTDSGALLTLPGDGTRFILANGRWRPAT